MKSRRTASSASSRPSRPAARSLDVQGRPAEETSSRSRSAWSQSTAYTFDHADEAARWNLNGTAAGHAAALRAGRPPEADLQGRAQHWHHLPRRRAGPHRAPGPAAAHAPAAELDAGTAALLHLLPRRRRRHAPARSARRQGRAATTSCWTPPATAKFPITITVVPGDRDQRGAAEGRLRHLRRARGRLLGRRREPRRSPDLQPDAAVLGRRHAPTAATGRSRRSPTSSSPPRHPALAKSASPRCNGSARPTRTCRAQRRHHRPRRRAADLKLARQTLETGGCDLIPLAGAAADRPTRDTIPCYYVPGNHESYTRQRPGHAGELVSPSSALPLPHVRPQGHALRPAGSSLGTLRTSDLAQLPMLQAALDDADDRRRDRQRDGVRPPPGRRPGRARRLAS